MCAQIVKYIWYFQKNKLIPDLIKKLLKGDTINLINYNLNRDYLYISDLLSATDKIVNSFPNGFSLFTVFTKQKC